MIRGRTADLGRSMPDGVRFPKGLQTVTSNSPIFVDLEMPRLTLHVVPNSESQRPNLYLVGFMGTGKSTIGRRVADDLGMTFVDSDREIEAKEGRTITEIFAQEGEAAFRAMERDFIESGHASEGLVVACGGGLVVEEGMLEILEESGVLICLCAGIDTILKRVSSNTHRPLIQAENQRERITTLMEVRAPIYGRISTQIMTDHRASWEVVQRVKRAYLEAASMRGVG